MGYLSFIQKQTAGSFRYDLSHAPPKITPHAPSPFPRISIHNTKFVHQPGFFKLCNIRRLRRDARARKRLTTGLIQIQLQRVAKIPCRKSRSSQSVARSVYTVRYQKGDGGVILRDEIAPDGHDSFVEVGPLVWEWRANDRCYIDSVRGANDRVLVFISYTVVICERFGEPVCRANESCFCVDVLKARY